MLKKNLFFVIVSLSFFSCKTKDDVLREEEISGVRVKVADQSEAIESINDRLLVIKGEIEKFAHGESTVKEDLSKNYDDLKVKYIELEEKIQKDISNLKIEFENAINNLKSIIENKTVSESKKSISKEEDFTKLEVDERYKKALSFYDNKKFEESLAYFKSLIGSKSKWYDEQGRYYNGQILSELGKHDESIVELQDFITKYPKSKLVSKALLRQGDSFLKLNMPKEAKVSYKDILQKYPNSKDAVLAKEKLKTIK